VRRAEHGHRTERDEHPPHVGARDRDGIGVGRVDDRLDEVAGLDDGGEQLELPRRALELAAQPSLGQTGLRLAHRDDPVARGAPRDGGAMGRGDGAVGPIHLPQRYEQVARRLAADIAAARLAPGERLPSERDLARSLGVGRASVREALAALANQGLLETRPGSGSFVAADAAARLDSAELPHDASPSDLLEARALLEPAVARLAAGRTRRDPEIEDLLAQMEEPVDQNDPRDRA